MVKNLFCWNESSQEGWFALDKLQHFLIYLVATLLLLLWRKWNIWIVLSGLEALGFIWELFEMTDEWGWFCKAWDRSWLGKIIKLGSKAVCASIKDLIVNNIGIGIGVLIWWLAK